MKFQDFKTVEDLVTDESFLNYYFQKNENDILDWEDWQEDSPKHVELVQEAFQLIDRLSLKFNETQIKEKLQDLKGQLEKLDSSVVVKKPFLYRLPSIYIKIAASIALLIAATWFFFYKNDRNTEGGVALKTKFVENKSVAKVSVYELSDGSVVRLNTGSSIRLADDYNKNSRDIYLEGEGYFEVAKDATKPFRVYAKKSLTTAIGTAFTVRAVKGEETVKVVLVEGIVKVENIVQHNYTIELKAGQQILIKEKELTHAENITDINLATRWKDGYVLAFRETPFSDVIKALSENYKKPIVGFEQMSLKNAPITAEFDKTTPLLSIMEALAFANGFKYVEKNDTLFIR
jgi:transmembrane sensor